MIKQLVVFFILSCSGNLSFAQQTPAGNTYAFIIGVSQPPLTGKNITP